MRYSKRKTCFTLIEVIVVIAIIAVLAAVIAPNEFRVIEKSRIAKTRQDINAIKAAIGGLYADTGNFPNGCPPYALANPEVSLYSPQAGLTAKPAVGAIDPVCGWSAGEVQAWDGPYIESYTYDFWKHPYEYDPDYGGCATCDWCSCPPTAAGYAKRVTPCPDPPNTWFPAVSSYGEDGTAYTCDDIFVLMRVQ